MSRSKYKDQIDEARVRLINALLDLDWDFDDNEDDEERWSLLRLVYVLCNRALSNARSLKNIRARSKNERERSKESLEALREKSSDLTRATRGIKELAAEIEKQQGTIDRQKGTIKEQRSALQAFQGVIDNLEAQKKEAALLKERQAALLAGLADAIRKTEHDRTASAGLSEDEKRVPR